jgi:hypothetical protein
MQQSDQPLELLDFLGNFSILDGGLVLEFTDHYHRVRTPFTFEEGQGAHLTVIQRLI